MRMSKETLTEDQKKARKLLSNKQHRHIMLYGGSRSGKTFLLVRCVFLRGMKAKSRHLIVRKAFNHAKQSLCYDTIPKVLDICFPDVKVKLNKSDWYYELPNGSQVWIGGLDDKERVEKILGNEYSTIYMNEGSQISWHAVETVITRLAQKTMLRNMCYYDENPPSKRHWSYKLFIEGKNPLDGTPIKKEKYACMMLNPEGNKQNLSDDYMDTLDSLSSRQRKRFKDGLFSDDAEGALWKSGDIVPYRITRELYDKEIDKEIKYRATAIDPAVSSNEDSDETGIITGSKSKDGHYYILADDSTKGTPNEWGSAAINAHDKHGCNKIIGEVNNGGDLVESNIKNIRRNVSFKQVRASKGKAIRAEPIVALYEQGLVHHVGVFDELEDEMTSWNPITDKSDSPDHVDALVWLLTELSGSTTSEFRVRRLT
jgi:predicted phage terminase large subunit-like protein